MRSVRAPAITRCPWAARLEPAGVLEILDVRRSFLEHTVKRARRSGLTNVVPTLGDGRALPYPNRCFDAAYMITVLGEIPDPKAALGELRRVLKPGGRLVCRANQLGTGPAAAG